MILVMAMISSLPNFVVSLMIHLLVVVVSLLMLLYFHVVVSLVLLRLHVVVSLVHLLLLYHLRALTELWWRLVQIVRMLQLVNRRRLLMLNMVAQLLVAGWWLLHLLLGPLLRLLLVVRMLSLVTTLVVERHSTSVPHARVAQIMHGRVEMAQGSTSIALLLHRNRGMAMGLSNWRGRSRWRHSRS